MLEPVRAEKMKFFSSLHKRIIKNFMDILVLSELKRSPLSGYDVMTFINQEFNFLPSSGSVYALLNAFERQGLVKGDWNERKRIYILTRKGEETVEAAGTARWKIENLVTRIFSSSLTDFSLRKPEYQLFES